MTRREMKMATRYQGSKFRLYSKNQKCWSCFGTCVYRGQECVLCNGKGYVTAREMQERPAREPAEDFGADL
jgi:DnaJ-class molecular chaperone